MSKKKTNKFNDQKLNEVMNNMENQIHQDHQSPLSGRLSFKDQYEFSEKQLKVLAAMMHSNSKVVFVEGVSGTAKTFLSIFAALKLIDQKKCNKIMYIRSLAESASKSIGALKGSLTEKLNPFLLPLEEKMEEIIHPQSYKRLMEEKRMQGIPVNFLRGASIKDSCAIIDEAQDFTFEELITVMTRIGENSKFFIIGDPMQSDIGKKTGFRKMIDIFNDDDSVINGIHYFKFGKEDIVRSGILKFIMEKIEEGPKQEPMFEDSSIYHKRYSSNGHTSKNDIKMSI